MVSSGRNIMVAGLLGMLAGLSNDEELRSEYASSGGKVEDEMLSKTMSCVSQVVRRKRGEGVKMVIDLGEMELFAEALVDGGRISLDSQRVDGAGMMRVMVSGINRRLRDVNMKFGSVRGSGRYLLGVK